MFLEMSWYSVVESKFFILSNKTLLKICEQALYV